MNDFTKQELIQINRTLCMADIDFFGIEELKSKISSMIDNYPDDNNDDTNKSTLANLHQDE